MECDSVARLTSDFDRLSNDVSGFGPAHRGEEEEESSDSRDDDNS